MKLRILVAAFAALFALQSGAANAATSTSRTSAKAAAAAKSTAKKAAVKPKAVAAKSAAAKKAAAKPAAKGKVASQAKTTKKSAAKAARSKAAPVRVSLRKAAPAALALAPASVLASEPDEALAVDAGGMPVLGSSAFYVINQNTGEVLLERNGSAVLPIASITKLMTAMVVLDSGLGLSEQLVITEGDIDRLKGTGSRLSLGTALTREDMLHLALMSSENRAASALARNYPGGEAAFVEAMNVKARLLGLWNTRFHDSTGLNPANVSSPRDLAKLVAASASYPLIRQFSTSPERYVDINGRTHRFGNTNSLVRSPEWAISVSKTGYISEAGRCLVMQTWLHQQPVVMVLMDSQGRYTRTADAKRVRKWLEQNTTQRVAAAGKGIDG
ncbi:D-alanyl-D-alanine endopeptidase [Thauera sp. GDN1]|uniref:D-alanyl-D-alanine endopeptidase n=1 Tax=Thauera sp. GDN1 TaxID=2944810 RepID=UPI00247A69B2|nr:D-alanyl-D-alanine endopeptidase [Thauera sp. GDN1]WEN41160.1 D-alanyl-D-alanine endopeptidase [Thauera sp. GDN1]